MTDIALEAALDRFEKAAFEKFANLPRGKAERAEVVASREAEYNSSREAIRTYLRTSPSQVAPANPAQVTDAEERGRQIYRNRLGKKLDEWKLEHVPAATIGAGGQAVAEDAETLKARAASVLCEAGALCGWPAPNCNAREGAEALFKAGLLALSQPHPADERMVEAASAVLKWLDGGCSSWSVPEQQIRILAISATEGR